MEAFRCCGEELNLESDLIEDVVEMITTTSTGHQTEVRRDECGTLSLTLTPPPDRMF